MDAGSFFASASSLFASSPPPFACSSSVLILLAFCSSLLYAKENAQKDDRNFCFFSL
jgi:hypothetical protein